MIKRRKKGFVEMLFLTFLIILGSLFGIYFLGSAAEKHLFSQEVSQPALTPMECKLYDITYPWDTPENLLTPESKFPTHPNRDYLESLLLLAEEIGDHITVETTNLWRDEDGLLIHKGENENSLSYAINTAKGRIVGYGIQPVTTTSASEKQKNEQYIRTLLSSASEITTYISEAHLFFNAAIGNSFLHLQPISKYNRLTAYETINPYQYEHILQEWSDELNALSYETCYHRNVLSIICSDDAPCYILQCDPVSSKITSCLLLN